MANKALQAGCRPVSSEPPWETNGPQRLGAEQGGRKTPRRKWIISPHLQGIHLCPSGSVLIGLKGFWYFGHVHVCTLKILNRKVISLSCLNHS